MPEPAFSARGRPTGLRTHETHVRAEAAALDELEWVDELVRDAAVSRSLKRREWTRPAFRAALIGVAIRRLLQQSTVTI